MRKRALAQNIIKTMQQTQMPNGISGVGYGQTDLAALLKRAIAQQRFLRNAPVEFRPQDLMEQYADAIHYW